FRLRQGNLTARRRRCKRHNPSARSAGSPAKALPMHALGLFPITGWIDDCFLSVMQDIIHARLDTQISEPELSKMWESERTTFTTGSGDGIDDWLTAPELVIESHDSEVTLRFYSGEREPEHRKVKSAFERAVRRYLPDVRID